MESRINKALENHKKGYNCCQAAACAYSDPAEKLLFAEQE